VNNGMSLMSLLLALSIFSGLFLIFNRWTTEQRKSAVRIFQEFQAIQIAENQAQRQFLGLSCENSVQQNGIQFTIQCSQNNALFLLSKGRYFVRYLLFKPTGNSKGYFSFAVGKFTST